MSFYIGVFSYVAIYAMLAMSFTLVHGTAGMFTIAHAAFFGLGAYGSAMIARLVGPELMVLGVLGGSVLAMLCAYVVAQAALRERGQYLMLVTFSVQIIFSVGLLNLPFTGGDNGIGEIPPLAIGSLAARGPIATLVVAWCLAFFVYGLIRHIEESSLGRVLRALREDELSVEALGANAFDAKLFAFCVSAGIAGFAGAIFAHSSGYINPASFSFEIAILVVTISVLGGQYSLLGAIAGSFVVVWLPYVIGFIGIDSVKVALVTQLIYGVVVMLVLFGRPSGLVPERLRRYDLDRP